MLAKLPVVESERTVSKLEKEKVKLGSFNSRATVHLRNVQKRVMHAQSCYFADINLLLFCCSPCRVDVVA